MHMDAIGYNHRHEQDFNIERPEGTADWLLLIIKSPVAFKVKDQKFRFPAHTFIIYTPQTPQYYSADCEEYFDDWMHFIPDKEEANLLSDLKIPLNVPIALSDTQSCSEIVTKMCYEFYSRNNHRTTSVDLLFRLLLYKLNEEIEKTAKTAKRTSNVYSEKLMWIRESIYRWPSRDYTVDDMAAELSLSRSRFQHIYSNFFGNSVSKDILSARLNKASELLKTTRFPIKDISRLVGYGDNVSYFVRIFRSNIGLSPGQYRKRHIIENNQ